MGDAGNTNGQLHPGVPATSRQDGNGNVVVEDGVKARGPSKRKSRGNTGSKSHAEPESSEDKPLVRHIL
jgi:hypothetical protein